MRHMRNKSVELDLLCINFNPKFNPQQASRIICSIRCFITKLFWNIIIIYPFLIFIKYPVKLHNINVYLF